MIVPGLYRLHGFYTSPANTTVVKVVEVTEKTVKCQNELGKIVELSHQHFEMMNAGRIDESTAYGNCTKGNCEM